MALIVSRDGVTSWVPEDPSSWPSPYRCDLHQSRPFPPSPVQPSSSSLSEPAEAQWTFPSSDVISDLDASEVEVTSLPSPSSGPLRARHSSSSSPEAPSSSTSAYDESSSSLVLSSSSSLSSVVSLFSTSSSTSAVSTPELTTSVGSERFSERLPFTLVWTADNLTSPCVVLT